MHLHREPHSTHTRPATPADDTRHVFRPGHVAVLAAGRRPLRHGDAAVLVVWLAAHRLHRARPVLVGGVICRMRSVGHTDRMQGRLSRLPGPLAARRKAGAGAWPRGPRCAPRLTRGHQSRWRAAALEVARARIGAQVRDPHQRHRHWTCCAPRNLGDHREPAARPPLHCPRYYLQLVQLPGAQCAHSPAHTPRRLGPVLLVDAA